jgi:hypothetical protein
VNNPLDDDTPLNDPDYVPLHPPVGGRIPEVVVRWGMRSQLRWFERFWDEVREQRAKLPMVWVGAVGRQPYERRGESEWTPLSEYWCDSQHHKGPHCGSCLGEFEDGFGVLMDGYCCCRQIRES